MPDAVTNTPRSSGGETVWLSIVMPAYNAAATIGLAIESVLVQTHGLFELVIIDDCSTDGTAAGVRGFADRDGRVRLIQRLENTGASACMNAGVAAAHDWVGIFDADAVAPPEWLARAAAIADASRSVGYDAFGGPCDYFPPKKRFERIAHAFEADDTAIAAETFDGSNAQEPTIRGTNFFFTRRCFERVGGFAEDIRAAYDRLFLCNAIEQGCRVRFDPLLRVGHPLPGSTVSEFLRRKNAIERWRLVAADRSPILRRVYWPIWPVVMVGLVEAIVSWWLVGPAWAVVIQAVAAVLVLLGFAAKGLIRGLTPAESLVYAGVNVVKKACTVAIYCFRLRPAGRDWKRRH